MSLPPLADLLERAHGFRVPLRTRFRGVTVREGVLFDGPVGWAEFAPFDDYDDAGAARWLAAAVEQGWVGFPMPVRDEVPVNVIIPSTSPALAAQMTRDVVASTGCTTVKVKVADPTTSIEDDVARIMGVRRSLDDVLGADEGLIRIDANGAWQVEQAIDALAMLDDAAGGLEYVEQPCRELADCARVRERGVVPIAVDEAIRRADDPHDPALHARLREAADIVVLKSLPSGGVREALTLARAIDLPVVVSGSLDTSVGLASGVALATSLPELGYACGLGTGALLERDVAPALLPIGGVLRRPGPARVDVDRSHLLPVPGEWSRRIADAHEAWSGRQPD